MNIVVVLYITKKNMLRNCAAILFVCFDMTACDALSLFSRPAALDYETPADREGRQSGLNLR